LNKQEKNLPTDNIFERNVDSYYFSTNNSIGYKIKISFKIKDIHSILK